MKYNGWLIYNQEDAEDNLSYINWFQKEAEVQDIALEVIVRETITLGILTNKRTVLINNRIVKLPDFAVVRTIDPQLSLQLEAMGIHVFNSSAVSRICNNKALTHHYVHELQVPMVNTVFTSTKLLQHSPLPDLPIVLKEAAGRGGKQVFLIETKQDLQQAVETLSSSNIIMQSCDVIPGKDLRVFIVGSKIIGSVIRENDNDFRANYKLGGTASWYTLHAEEISLINRIVNHFQFDMVGIDFLFKKDGTLLFNEIEDVVGSRTLSAVSDVNILQKYITHIKSKLI
ncbi:hypothetical protein CFK37_13350 [Virgibacillus phasianinus]|uniref:ATP-grasp domain-containing protein n=1 Tax=Virgibacillus phasianinus TaxID=2017483 RepID=A0A220U4P2_9BACI|nr:ATP-grasp domain-containing protein [Virgibacillus phasianinus]ASK63060.1 hypothetical protein CFK37_13350 [Virgibacillus phasianinus]